MDGLAIVLVFLIVGLVQFLFAISQIIFSISVFYKFSSNAQVRKVTFIYWTLILWYFIMLYVTYNTSYFIYSFFTIWFIYIYYPVFMYRISKRNKI